ncbi:MAG: hypothetical protein ACTSQB_06290 [Candidatus Heimdallarchaeota archaeon]
MAFPATLRRLIIALNGYDGPEYYQAGDSLMKPGYVVMEDDGDEVKTCISTGKPIGIVGCDADHDMSTVYSAGERIPIFPLGCGVDLYVACIDTTTITLIKGAIIDTADGTTYLGRAKVKDAYIVHTTANANTAGTERNTLSTFWIGRALETGSITSEVMRYVPVKLSL